MGLAPQDGMTLHSPQPPTCQPPLPVVCWHLQVRMMLGGGGEAGAERRWPGCAHALKRNTENQKKKAWQEQSLAL